MLYHQRSTFLSYLDNYVCFAAKLVKMFKNIHVLMYLFVFTEFFLGVSNTNVLFQKIPL